MLLTEEVTGWIVDEEDSLEIDTLFMYDTVEPYTVSIKFAPNAIWEISREALMECLRTGEGGFLNTVFVSDGDMVMMILTGDENEILTIEFVHSELTSFIHMTYEAVPENKEEVDIDDLIAGILENTKLKDE